jgi:hypothetical protein
MWGEPTYSPPVRGGPTASRMEHAPPSLPRAYGAGSWHSHLFAMSKALVTEIFNKINYKYSKLARKFSKIQYVTNYDVYYL